MITSAKIIGAGISYAVYSAQAEGIRRGHRDFIMSRGELMNCASNPKRWLDGYREDDDADTDATKWGNLIECLAGLNGKFEDRYAVAPSEYADAKTGEMKPWTFAANVCKAWREEQGEREVIKSELNSKAEEAHQALCADGDVCELFKCSRKQVMVVGTWQDQATEIEIPIRCLLDLVPDQSHPVFGKSLADFKTARNGNPAKWPSVVDDSGYDVQAALSIDLYVKASGEFRTDWYWPVQENVHPYHVVKPIPAATSEFLAWGRLKYRRALRLYAQCLATGIWPSYPTVGVVMGPAQLLGPETIYAYREYTGGEVQLTDIEPKQPPAPDSDRPDIVPVP